MTQKKMTGIKFADIEKTWLRNKAQEKGCTITSIVRNMVTTEMKNEDYNFTFTYIIKDGSGDFYKVGVSTDPYSELLKIKKHNPKSCLICVLYGNKMDEMQEKIEDDICNVDMNNWICNDDYDLNYIISEMNFASFCYNDENQFLEYEIKELADFVHKDLDDEEINYDMIAYKEDCEIPRVLNEYARNVRALSVDCN